MLGGRLHHRCGDLGPETEKPAVVETSMVTEQPRSTSAQDMGLPPPLGLRLLLACPGAPTELLLPCFPGPPLLPSVSSLLYHIPLDLHSLENLFVTVETNMPTGEDIPILKCHFFQSQDWIKQQRLTRVLVFQLEPMAQDCWGLGLCIPKFPQDSEAYFH